MEAVEQDVTNRLTELVLAAGPATPAEALRLSASIWLDLAAEPEVRQILLLDAPSVLGWTGFREIAQKYGVGLTEQLLVAAMDAGELQRQPTRALAAMLLGALNEAALAMVNAQDAETTQVDVRLVCSFLIDGLLNQP